MLDHQNIHHLLGITGTFDFPISIVAEWSGQHALDYVQDPSIDPRPLVSSVVWCVLVLIPLAVRRHCTRTGLPTYSQMGENLPRQCQGCKFAISFHLSSLSTFQ